jgi:hypothetical protein
MSLQVVLLLLPVFAAISEIHLRGTSESALLTLLLIQMLSVSTGFDSHASRGYYDPPLALCSRGRVAAAHFLASALPGFAAWLAIGVVQAVAGEGWAPAFQPAGIAALALVSTLPWAVSVRFGPMSGGVGWLVLWGALFVTGKAFPLLGMMVAYDAESPLLVRAGAGILIPLAVPSTPWRPAELFLFFAAAAGAAAAAAAYLHRASFPLRETDS